MRAGRCGDLVIQIALREHNFFKTDGHNLTCTVPVTLYEAILGGDIEVPTVTGKVIMKIHTLTQSGRIHRLKGLGLAGGDLLVSIEVTIPQKLQSEEVELFKRLEKMSTMPNPRNAVFEKLSNPS